MRCLSSIWVRSFFITPLIFLAMPNPQVVPPVLFGLPVYTASFGPSEFDLPLDPAEVCPSSQGHFDLEKWPPNTIKPPKGQYDGSIPPVSHAWDLCKIWREEGGGSTHLFPPHPYVTHGMVRGREPGPPHPYNPATPPPGRPPVAVWFRRDRLRDHQRRSPCRGVLWP